MKQNSVGFSSAQLGSDYGNDGSEESQLLLLMNFITTFAVPMTV